MAESFWKLRYSMWMFFKTSGAVDLKTSWSFADGWVDSFGMDESPLEAVNEEISCWG